MLKVSANQFTNSEWLLFGEKSIQLFPSHVGHVGESEMFDTHKHQKAKVTFLFDLYLLHCKSSVFVTLNSTMQLVFFDA